MKQIEIIQEIALALSNCNSTSCDSCSNADACLAIFGKKFITQEILELAQQCKEFNKFARANRKE